MGGGVSELRGEIHRHVLIAKHYPLFLEPNLAVMRYFLRTAEEGEGADKDRPIDDMPMDFVITNKKKIFEEASTEVELLVENTGVTKVILNAIQHFHELELAPEFDPFHRWYDPPWRKQKKMRRYLELAPTEVPRFRVAVLRTAIRCLRLMVQCKDAATMLENLDAPVILNDAVVANPLDDYVKKDVKAIFSAIYGGDNAVKRIVIGNVQVVVEMMMENSDSAIVQVAGVKRLCRLLADVHAVLYSSLTNAASTLLAGRSTNGSSSGGNQQPANDHPPPSPEEIAKAEQQLAKLFHDFETTNAVVLVTKTLTRFDVDQYLALYMHVCRFIAFVAMEEHNTKLVGQHGGIEGSIRLLFKAREMQRQKKAAAREEAARQARRKGVPPSEWSDAFDRKKRLQPAVVEAEQAEVEDPNNPQPVLTVGGLASVEFTPIEIGQQAIWALDLLATLDFNVSMMKLHRLKYMLEEIRLDPDAHELGSALVVTRRLRLIRWDEIGNASTKK
ncbi:TPA: hypothetical protein N0F65_007076 [Lagenidium giganteum]|uniref:Uncharacterized protein n=1 Tax=Lagenidium giganteum TaxID=4803 RepID=A0AAV2YPB4_9STRA|nr:TPA: hypothetical protein N0F65_007076 [Lagenidium giganteum]